MINNPYDKVIKFALKNKEEAETFFRNFLPTHIVEKLDFNTLELDDCSYIDENLQENYADVTYDIIWNNKTPIKISLLLEHKSYKVTYPHFQKLRYMLNIWEYQLAQNEKLRPVIPIVLYHDKAEWKVRPMYDYFEGLDEELRRFIPHFDYLLVNLEDYSDEEIMQIKQGFLMTTLLLFKHKKDRKYLEKHYREVFLFLKTDLNPTVKTQYTNALFVFMEAVYGLIKEDFVSLGHRLSDVKKNTNMEKFLVLNDEMAVDLLGKFKDREQAIGEAKGQAKGEAIGELKSAITIISNFIQNFPTWSDEQIAEGLGKPLNLIKEIRTELEAGRDPKTTLNPQPKAALGDKALTDIALVDTPLTDIETEELLKEYVRILTKKFPRWSDKKIASLLEQKKELVQHIRESLPPPVRGFAGVENSIEKRIDKIINAHRALPISKTFVKQLFQQYPNWPIYTISELAVVTDSFVEEIKKELEQNNETKED